MIERLISSTQAGLTRPLPFRRAKRGIVGYPNNQLVIDAVHQKEARPSNRAGEFPHAQLREEPTRRPKLEGSQFLASGAASRTSSASRQAASPRQGDAVEEIHLEHLARPALRAVHDRAISGDYPEDGNGFAYPEDDGDLKLVPDLSTRRCHGKKTRPRR